MSAAELAKDSNWEKMESTFASGVEIHTVIQLNRLGELLSRPFLQIFAEDHNITLTEWRVMLILAGTTGYASQDVAEATGIHPMNISRAVTKLRKSQYVAMVKDAEDHRRRILHLTDAGWEIYEQLIPVAKRAALDLFSVLDRSEQAVFAEFVQRLGTQAEKLVGSELAASRPPEK